MADDDVNLPTFSTDQISAAMTAPDTPPAGTQAQTAAAPVSAAPQPIPAYEAPAQPKPPEFTQSDISEAYDQSSMDDRQALRSNLMQASQENPDQVAKALPIAQKMGLPVPTVQRNLDTLTPEQKYTMDYVSNLQKQFPNTAAWLSDPTNAAMGHDDIDNMAKMEGLSDAANIVDHAALATYDQYQAGKYFLGALTGNQQAMDSARGNLTFSKQYATESDPHYTGIGGFLYRAIQGTAEFAPALASAILNPLLGVAAFGASGLTSESGDVLARGGTTKQAAAGGAISGTINAAVGPIFGPLAGSLLAKTSLPEWAAHVIAHGVTPMTVMGVANSATDTAIANPNKTWGDFLKELPSTVGESAMQGLLFHVGGLGYDAAKDATMSRFSAKYAAAKAAANTAPILDAFNQTAAVNKLRERSPDSFNSFMQSATEDSPINTLWIEQDAMQKAGVTPDALAAALPQHSADILDAAANGYAARVPAADFATSLAGTPIGDALVPHLKTDPNGMSATEADEYLTSGAAKEFVSEMEKAHATDTGNADFEASAKAVETQIAARYAATGRFPKDVNATTARLGSFYRVLAKEYGITPEEAYRRHGAGITGADMQPTGEAFGGAKAKAAASSAAPETLDNSDVDDINVADMPAAQSEPTPEDMDHAEIDRALTAIRAKTPNKAARFPILSWLKSRGGIDPASRDATELRNMDIDPTTMPGLFTKPRRSSGMKNEVGGVKLDNIPTTEFPEELGATGQDQEGTLDRDWLLNRIDDELRHNPDAAAEDQRANDIAAELQQYKIDPKKLTADEVKKKLTAARVKDVRAQAKKSGFGDLSKQEALNIDRLRRQGYDIEDATDSVLERAALQAVNEIGQNYGQEPDEIPFDLPEPAGSIAGTDDGTAPGVDNEGAGTDENGDAGGQETPGETRSEPADDSGTLFDINEDSAADIARRDADRRLKGEGSQKGLNDLDLFDENGRIIDSQDKLFQKEGNASYNPTTKEIWLGKGANLSSMLHEEGHHFLNVYTALAAEPGAPQRIIDIADAALKGLDVEGATPQERLANWKAMSLEEQRDGHEQWARSFERYLFRGKAPSIELQPAFDAFRGWLKSVYGSIKDFVLRNPEAGKVGEDIRGVMDRMLATDDEIDYARRVRNFGSLFRTPEEAGMTEDEYKAYQALGAQSINDAASELQARSIRDMALTRRLHDKAVRQLKMDAVAKRKGVEDEVTQQVLQEPVNRARTFLKKGEIDGKDTGGIHRLDIDILKDMYGDDPDAEWRLLNEKYGAHGIIGKGGLHPDDVAQQFGFETGGDMIRSMVNQPSVRDHIADLTDQRMIERYGDLTDPATIQRRADQAVHNEARIRFVADELNAARKAVGKSKIMKDAAKEYAGAMINRQKVSEIEPNRYAAAAAKAARVAEDAMKTGDLAAVAEAKRNQLVNEYATKLAYEALDAVRKIRDNAKRYEKAPVRKRIGTDIEQIDALMDQYDMRVNQVERTNNRQQSLLQWYQSQIDADYEPLIDDKILQNQQKTHYADLSLSDLKSLDVALRTIEQTARVRKEIRIDGKRVAVNTAVAEMVQRMQERGDKFTTQDLLNRPRKGVDSFYKVALDRMASAMRAGVASLTGTDYLANKYDSHEIGGPFRRFIFDPIMDRNYWKRQQLSDISQTFGEKVKELGEGWQKSLYDKVPNSTLIDAAASTDTNPVYRQLTRGDLIGIARHVGNESNFRKLTDGMKWNPADVWRYLDANMRASDWKAVEAEWDAFEKHWPEIEGMIRRLGGEVPEKIPLRPFKTRFGEMKGGYAPIEYDPLRSRLAARIGDVSADATKSISKTEYYKATSTMNSSLRNRSEGYSDIVNLDYHYMTRRLHETVHDLAYREAILDAKKIMEHSDFRDQFQKTFGREEYENLQKFVGNVRDELVRDQGMDGFEKAIQYTRQGIIMNGIGYRLTTVLKHGSSAGLKSLGFIEGPGKKYLAARALRMAGGNLQADIADARAKFPEISARLQRMDRDFSAGEHTLYDKEGWKEKNNRFSHAMVAWSDALTAIPTAHAAYDWAITEGIPKRYGGTGKPMEPAAAIKFANGVVRQAHGSALESARSSFLHEKGMASLLGMIYGFQNNTFGQLRDTADKAFAASSRYTDRPALAGRLMAQLIAPAIVGYLVGNGWTKDPWYKQLTMAIGGELASTVPLLRDGWSMVESMAEGRDWRSSALALPPVRVAGDIVQAVGDAVKEVKGKSTKIIQDAGNAIGEVFHVAGLGQAGKTLQYMHDVHVGKQHPQNALQYLKGATIGPPPKNAGATVSPHEAEPHDYGGGLPLTQGGVLGTK